MVGFDWLGKVIIIFGLVLVAIGIFLLGMPNHPWSGRKAGDVVFRRKNFTTYFPRVTLKLVSILLHFLFAIFGK